MKVLFVCTGNTCRSPMAEGLARQILGPDIQVESAGIAAWEGEPASQNALEILKEKEIDLTSHRSRRITEGLLVEVDWIIPMTQDQGIRLKAMFPKYAQKIKQLGAWDAGLNHSDILDPWGGNVEVYRKSAEKIELLIHRLKQCLDNECENG